MSDHPPLQVWTESGFVGSAKALGRLELPGLCNAHSHAFQRAMAGLCEHRTHAEDSFWTWRETMYRFAGCIGPEALRTIAAQLYVEMLEAGYTSVCEFQYLHHQPDGAPYADPAEMSRALIGAARDTGIRLTLLPVLYMTGGFDGRSLSARQRRFGHSVDAFLKLLELLRREEDGLLTVGMALHSLRAVPAEAMAEVLAVERSHDRPIHLHISEQLAEVEECAAVRGQRPVAWLLDHADIGPRWTLVHATHIDQSEIAGLAASGATVAICPTTEANLGDGLFPLKSYLDADGAIAIGSDSHISVSPVEELRWLEYGQRLQAQRRSIAVSSTQTSVGACLFAHVVRGGLKAAGSSIDNAGAIVLDDEHPLLVARSAEQVIDTWIFSGNAPLVRDVVVSGATLVKGGRHRAREPIAQAYRTTMKKLAANI